MFSILLIPNITYFQIVFFIVIMHLIMYVQVSVSVNLFLHVGMDDETSAGSSKLVTVF